MRAEVQDGRIIQYRFSRRPAAILGAAPPQHPKRFLRIPYAGCDVTPVLCSRRIGPRSRPSRSRHRVPAGSDERILSQVRRLVAGPATHFAHCRSADVDREGRDVVVVSCLLEAGGGTGVSHPVRIRDGDETIPPVRQVSDVEGLAV